MSVTIFNLDKVVRETFEITIEGKNYNIKEPTVADFSLIQQLDFEKDKSAGFKIINILCKELEEETILKLTQQQFNLLVAICFKLTRGEGRKKNIEVEELME